MATTFPVIPQYRAGVKNFTIFWRAPGTIVWNNYETGGKIPIGYDVRFTPVLNESYVLISERAYYLSAYGEYVDLVLNPDISTGAFQFTMPSASVYITATANSQSSDDWIFPTYTNSGYIRPTRVYTSFVDFYNAYIGFGGRVRGLPEVVYNNFASLYNPNRICHLYCYDHEPAVGLKRTTIQLVVYTTLGVNTGFTINSTRFSSVKLYIYEFPQSDTITSSSSYASYDARTSSIVVEFIGLNRTTNQYRHFSFANVTSASKSAEPSPETSSIRYILSPENSGIITGPETFDSATFSFTYRIKTAYEFTRIRAFAVSEPTGTPPVPREEALVTSESYDGNTRTYTFTVTSIPDWATSVRCVIETIMLEDTQEQGGTNESSGPIGGDGTFDDTSDPVPLPAIPSGISAADSGLVTIFRPSVSQIKALGDYLWSNLDDFWENLQKIFTNPMDYIIALNIFPVRPLVTSDKAIYIGNWLTDISMPPVENQFYEFDCGTVNIDEYFGSYLDYAPNTTARIMLPFIGDREIAINEIMGHVLHLWYRIDLLSGNCLAVLTIANDVYYQWTGNCAIPVPVTGSDWSRLYSGIAKAGITIAGAAIGGAVGAAAGIGVSAGAGMGSLVTSNSIISDLAQPLHSEGPIRTSGGKLVDYYEDASPGTSKPNKSIPATSVAGAIGHNIMQGIPRVQHSGDLSGAISIMGNRTPFIVLEYPNVNLPEDYKHVMGYPSNQFVTLGNIKGYTECRTVLFESTKATDEEIEMIIKALKGGVYL